MYIGVDFDGTCVTHEFPAVGHDIGAAPVLRSLVEAGHKILLNTMRSGTALEDAKEWFASNNIALYGVNHNPDQVTWTSSPKVYAHVYIDDAALGCPLTIDERVSLRPYVNWLKVESYFRQIRALSIMEVG